MGIIILSSLCPGFAASLERTQKKSSHTATTQHSQLATAFFFSFFFPFRYKAIMNPLSERSSKTSAKVIIFGLWILGAIIASPMCYFFTLTRVYDESKGGMKPFCDIFSNIMEFDSGNSTNSTTSPPLFTPFQIYNLCLSSVQYLVPLCVITIVYVRMATKLWSNKTPGAALQQRDEMILVNKKKVLNRNTRNKTWVY